MPLQFIISSKLNHLITYIRIKYFNLLFKSEKFINKNSFENFSEDFIFSGNLYNFLNTTFY